MRLLKQNFVLLRQPEKSTMLRLTKLGGIGLFLDLLMVTIVHINATRTNKIIPTTPKLTSRPISANEVPPSYHHFARNPRSTQNSIEKERAATDVIGLKKNSASGLQNIHSSPIKVRRAVPSPLKSASSEMNTFVPPSCTPSVSPSCASTSAPVKALTKPQGQIEWNSLASEMPPYSAWSIDVTGAEEEGLVLELNNLHLSRGLTEATDDTLIIYREHITRDHSLNSLQPPLNINSYQWLSFKDGELQLESRETMGRNGTRYKFTPVSSLAEVRRVQGSLPVSPIIVRASQVLVVVEIHNSGNTSYQHDDLKSSFSLNYTAFPLALLPIPLDSGQYDCSPPSLVPPPLQCDMVEQCLGAEDETNCTYGHPLCGNWISSQRLCWKIVLPAAKISPEMAQNECTRMKPDSTLAFLTTPSLKTFAARLLSLRGKSRMVVGMRRIVESRAGTFEKYLYRSQWWWEGIKTIVDEEPLKELQDAHLNCAVLETESSVYYRPVSCTAQLDAGFACVKSIDTDWHFANAPDSIGLRTASAQVRMNGLRNCSDDSLSFTFYSCPLGLELNTHEDANAVTLSEFPCKTGGYVPYTLLLDGIDDCPDKSDEGSLYFVQSDMAYVCDGRYTLRVLTLPSESSCPALPECQNYYHDNDSYCRDCAVDPYTVYIPTNSGVYDANTGNDRIRGILWPTIRKRHDSSVTGGDSDENAGLKIREVNASGSVYEYFIASTECPETHLLCEEERLCIPTYFVGNGIVDCPVSSADEMKSFSWQLSCPGHYRCRDSGICVHPDFVCDGVFHCPYKDDELLCNLQCPYGCECRGFEYRCWQLFQPTVYERALLRYLDLSGVLLADLSYFQSKCFYNLFFLNVSSCGLVKLKVSFVDEFVNVRVLDLSFNKLTYVSLSDFYLLSVTHLNLSGNPLNISLSVDTLSLFFSTLAANRQIESLRLFTTGIDRIDAGVFSNFTHLKYLDLSDNAISKFEENSFLGLVQLEVLKVSDRRLCCVYHDLYGCPTKGCEAPVDEISSCSNLLKSDFLRACLWVQAIFALVGNAGVFVFRVFLDSRDRSFGFRTLVTNLCVADGLMGVYMVTIGGADAVFRGEYLWRKEQWTHSAQCQAAGFLSLLSTETSAFFICLITLDRFLVIRFPLRHSLHLSSRSILTLCAGAWVAGIFLSTVPLLPFAESWYFYSQTSVCLPLPFKPFGESAPVYSFTIYILLNFVLMLCVGSGQLSIYLAIRRSRKSLVVNTSRRPEDAVIARRLLFIVLTDVLCWLSVGVAGFLALFGVTIPEEVQVGAAVLVLPLHSALNPFLYTLHLLLHHRHDHRQSKPQLKPADQGIHTLTTRLQPPGPQPMVTGGHGALGRGQGQSQGLSSTSSTTAIVITRL